MKISQKILAKTLLVTSVFSLFPITHATTGDAEYQAMMKKLPISAFSVFEKTQNTLSDSQLVVHNPATIYTVDGSQSITKNNFLLLDTPTHVENYPKKLPLMGAVEADFVRKRGGIVAAYIQKRVETKLVKEDFRLAGSKNTDLNFWLQVLDDESKKADQFVVLPKQGLVMPINTVEYTSQAYKNFINGRSENFQQYLKTGAVEIPGTTLGDYGQPGNKVIAGHSSYWKDTDTKFKTHFQAIIALELGEEVWIYKKNPKTQKFTRYVYKAFASYNTDATDTSVLLPTKESIVTLFTCTPIGGVSGRWIVKAKLVGIDEK